MHMYSMTEDDLSENCNDSKNILLNHLFENGYLSQEVYEDYYKNYAFLVKKRSFFGKIWNNFIPKEKIDVPHYILVKQVNMKEAKNPEEIIDGK